MSLDLAIIKFKQAIKEKKSKEVVNYKFTMYVKEYENLPERDVIDKQIHRDLQNIYFWYMKKSEG